MTEGWIDNGQRLGYICNHCGETTETIGADDDWVETGVPTPDSQFDGEIAHFCPKCSLARELLQEASQHGDRPAHEVQEARLEDIRTWDKALGEEELDALQHFEVNRSRSIE